MTEQRASSERTCRPTWLIQKFYRIRMRLQLSSRKSWPPYSSALFFSFVQPSQSQSLSLIQKVTPHLNRHQRAALHLRMKQDCSGDYGAQRQMGTGVLHTSQTAAVSAEL